MTGGEKIESKDAVKEEEQQKIKAELIGGKIGALVLQTAGVAKLSGSAIAGLSEKVGVKKPAKGIRVVLKDDTVLVDIHIVAVFGRSIPEIARFIQKETKSLFNEEFPSYHLTAVNVWIDGLSFNEEAIKYRDQAIALLKQEEKERCSLD